MTLIITIVILLILYYTTIMVIIRPRRDDEFITIQPPEIELKEDNCIDPSIHAIACLLGSSNEALKTAKFVQTIKNNDTRQYILQYLKQYNIILFDKVMALEGVDLNAEEGFVSEIIGSENVKREYPLTPEEELLKGDIPFSEFGELDFSGVTNFTEYFNNLANSYIVKTVTTIQERKIEETASKLLHSSISSKSPQKLEKTFKEGEHVAQQIVNDITAKKEQNN
ncbi:hypothetical protein [Butyricimonas virosa]